MSPQDVIAALMAVHGRTYAEDLGIDVTRNTPSVLFRWLCASLLFSARIGAGIAGTAVRALAEAGWTTPQRMAGATWEERARVLNRAGYARYDEKTSRMLEATARAVIADYGGDLRRLRAAAAGDPAEIRRRLMAFKGIGPLGAAIFCRDMQAVWPELYPFLDSKAAESARLLGLPAEADALARLVPREAFPRLAAALVRSALAHDAADIRARAG